jgi:RNA polymerase sigma-70 factor (ECF subfamily)
MSPYPGVVEAVVVEVRTDEGIEQVYRDQASRLWGALVAYSADREVASDAVAEAFAQAIARWDAIDDPSRWVWTAAFRIARGELKRRRETSAPGGDMTSDVLELDRSADLLRALRTLPHRQRAALVLHYFVDMPTADIAPVLGIRPATVRVTLLRGRRRLQQLLEEQGG